MLQVQLSPTQPHPIQEAPVIHVEDIEVAVEEVEEGEGAEEEEEVGPLVEDVQHRTLIYHLVAMFLCVSFFVREGVWQVPVVDFVIL